MKVASLTISDVVTAVGSYIGHSFENLPVALRAFLTEAATSIQQTPRYLPQPILDTFTSLQTKTSTGFLYPTLLLASIFLLSMSGLKQRFWPSGGRSPLGAAAGSTPTVTDDDFSYMGPGDIVDPPLRSRGTVSHNEAYGFPQPRNTTRADSESLSPDVLTVTHKNVTYPILFPAFTISDGALKIGELRCIVAEKTRADDVRKVKLLYKGRILKDNLRACRDEGLKQNSELLCIVSEVPATHGYPGAGDDSSSSAGEDEILAAEGLAGPRVDVDGSLIDDGAPSQRRKGHRGGKKKKPSGSGVPSPRDSAHHLSHTSGPGPQSTSRPSSPKAPPMQQPAQQQAQRPKSAMEKVDELESTFRTQFKPLCVQFTLNPPSDSRARDLEYKRLSESIMAQIILKLDAVEMEGDEGARARRKALVKETQDKLNELDRVGKRGA
ncbi:MAG: hypothetical protein FRX48_08202 [Lasallia pustulata]|uniref:BAG domain-containing protein n=1 Tax=Lasallia pustulata TaxID=136370 RepID=A0A5M8PEW8_9LECA|nr:MAG: hypothetical protein FRX48_08202 [Lasallia pustulata]